MGGKLDCHRTKENILVLWGWQFLLATGH